MDSRTRVGNAGRVLVTRYSKQPHDHHDHRNAQPGANTRWGPAPDPLHRVSQTGPNGPPPQCMNGDPLPTPEPRPREYLPGVVSRHRSSELLAAWEMPRVRLGSWLTLRSDPRVTRADRRRGHARGTAWTLFDYVGDRRITSRGREAAEAEAGPSLQSIRSFRALGSRCPLHAVSQSVSHKRQRRCRT
jgi:hypothetical protein